MTAQLRVWAAALGGYVSGSSVSAPGPGHSAHDRSLSVTLDANAPDGFLVHSFAGDDPLACKDHVRAKLGLPEVQLGLLPGAGGTQRAARLAGADSALSLMLSGRHVDAHEALRLGLVDRVICMHEGRVIAEEVPDVIRRNALVQEVYLGKPRHP